ncbi:hypothetical protein [Saccharopolyspora antimicrobica]|uniref:hypothetical protein n=1 Tax=Saccharopolyspora antimicrobica TaxID=455193 RepID=UPI000B874862|nr:hypothetical protein [Saccharopolyspora antimicrobica]
MERVELHHNLHHVALHAGHLTVSGRAVRYETPNRMIIGGRTSNTLAAGAWLLDELATDIAATDGPCRISGSWHIGARFDDPALL